MKKSILAFSLISASIFSNAAQAECSDITITEMNWASGAVVTSVAKFLMEQGYGCTVQKVPSSTVPSVTSVAETGKPDILTELWLNSVPMYQELEKQGKVITATNVIADGGKDSWLVPKYLTDKHPELKTIEGVLANPELVGGRFHNAPDGWGIRIKNDNLIKAFDFSGHKMGVFNHGSGETLAASIASAYESKQPWFGYYWGPTSVLGKYEMTAVDMGTFNKASHDCIQSKDCANPARTSFPSATVITAVTRDLATREPQIYELMSNISFTSAEMSTLLAWQEKNKASAEETAVHFISQYGDTWSHWLNEDARQNLSSLLK